MKDYRGQPLKVGDKVIIIHRLRGGANTKKTPHVVMVRLNGKNKGAKSAGIVYHSTLRGPAPPPKDKNGNRVPGEGGSFSLATYCDTSEFIKVPDDLVDNPEAILAHVRMQGFEYE